MNKIHVRKAFSKDIGDMLEIQQAALPESLLTLSGPIYIRRAFYPIVLNHPGAKSYVLTINEHVNGFVFYGDSPTFFIRKLRQTKFYLMLSIISRFQQLPDLFFKYLQVIRRPNIVLNKDPGDAIFHLFLIAIAPNNQSKGLGSFLLNNSLKLAANDFDLNRCLLETKTPQALGFYKKNGFEEIGYEKRGSIRFTKMIRQID